MKESIDVILNVYNGLSFVLYYFKLSGSIDFWLNDIYNDLNVGYCDVHTFKCIFRTTNFFSQNLYKYIYIYILLQKKTASI